MRYPGGDVQLAMEIRAWDSRERLDGGEFTSIRLRLVFAAKGMEGITMRGARWVVCRALGHQEQERPLPKAQLELPVGQEGTRRICICLQKAKSSCARYS